MSLDDARREIEAAYAAAPIVGVPIGYDGHAFEMQAPAIRLTIRPGAAVQASLGSPGTNLARHAGIAFFEVITDGGKGSAEANGYAETIMGIYRNVRLGVVKCQVPFISATRVEAPYLIFNVAVPYTRDEFDA